MAYVSGTAASMAEIKTAIETEAVARGWSLTDDVLSKNGCYYKITTRETASSYLAVYGGTGQSGSTLTGQAQEGVAVTSVSGEAFSFPVSYEISGFDDTDEIYCNINYESSFYQMVALGISDVDGIGGTGAWLTGSLAADVASNGLFHGRVSVLISQSQLGFRLTSNGLGSPFWSAVGSSSTNDGRSSFVHSGLDSSGWSQESGSSQGNLFGISYCAALLTSLPNASNQSSPLLPIKAIKYRGSNGLTIVANLAHARYMRIDNVSAGEVISIGSEKWKCYPFLRKVTSVRNGESAIFGSTHTGTFGYAIRYQGP